MDDFYREYRKRLWDKYPCISDLGEPWQGRHVVSPYKVFIPQSVIDTVTEAVDNIFRLSRSGAYHSAVLDTGIDRDILSSPAKNLSVLMSYDFHIDGEVPRLLEINTNASGFLIAGEIYHAHKLDGPIQDPFASLKRSFFEEFDRLEIKDTPHIAIVDEAPQTQKMFAEFLLYQSIFEKWGCTAGIHDYRELYYRDGALLARENGQENKIDLVYNRYCDFTLSDPSSNDLRRAYLDGACGFSPNPKEYILLADKRRLAQLTRAGWLERVAAPGISVNSIRRVLLPTWDKTEFKDMDEIWQKRKQLFFKPAQSYAGKSAYRGSSITRKVFNRVMEENTLIQKYIPAPTVQFENDVSLADWKYDLRAYAYGGEVQLLAARIYQGQITNFNCAHGGYCPVFAL